MKRLLLITSTLFLLLCVLYCLYLSRPKHSSIVNRNVHYYLKKTTINNQQQEVWQNSSVEYDTIVPNVHHPNTNENDIQIASLSNPLSPLTQLQIDAPADEAAMINFQYECSDFEGTLVHIAVVMAPNNASLSLHLLIKSLLVNRHSPLHLHVLTIDAVAMTTVRTLLSTWIIPSFDYTLYAASNIIDKIPWINVESIPVPTLKLFFQVLIPPSIKQFIVLDIGALVIDDIGELWAYTMKYESDKATGVAASLLNSKVILYKRLATSSFLQTLNRSKVKKLSLTSMPVSIADMIDAFSLSPLIVPCAGEQCHKKVTVQQLCTDTSLQYQKTHTAMWYDGELLHNIHLKCNEKVSREKKQLQVSKKHYCANIFLIASYNYRTLLYFFGGPYNPASDHDVTLVTQATYDRISRLPILLSHWTGPVSIAIYVADSEMERLYTTLNDSSIIVERAKLNLAIYTLYSNTVLCIQSIIFVT